ncbi:caspase, EACC1-associated type [Frankia sp. Cr1]|uniref:caspase, EACC1-associated type n=1 Tax=Frankia sp. Cr1 TaxID=3073931 RepID=UPI002AD550F3|nr:caspase family protein [Frankia sp. Cr1]
MTAPRRPPLGDLAGMGARAVLVGTSRHTDASGLPDLPSVATTVEDLRRALEEVCGMEPAHIRTIIDPADEGAVLDAVEEIAAQATGVVLFYFAGHGLLGPGDRLYLATHASLAGDRIARSASYQTIRDILADLPASTVVMLDCCFSGLADATGRGRQRDPYASARPRGSYLLTSASHYAVSYAPPGERHTLFTGELLRLLHEGDPAGPVRLTLDHVYGYLDRRLQAAAARPHRQSDGRAGELVLASNPAYQPVAEPDDTSLRPPDNSACPYPGMEPFQAEDHERFFGREDVVQRLLGEVTGSDTGHRPVMLVGSSGVGKSSILRAGLLAGLDRRHDADRTSPWPAVLLAAPGAQPLQALAERLTAATGKPLDEVERQLLAGRLPSIAERSGGCAVLVVDQFEEVFTRCPDEDQRARFIHVLCAGSDTGPDRTRVVLGLRADHYGNCLAYPELVRALRDGQVTVPPLDDAGLRAAIERPAQAGGLVLQPGLTDLLLRDLREGGSSSLGTALPFLAHALRATWTRRSGRTLTFAGYQATGGIWRSVTRTAEEIHDTLSEPGRLALRDLLLHMVHLSDSDSGGEAVRRRVDLREITHGRSNVERQIITLVCDRLAQARLLTVDDGGAQLSHEALLRAWPRLRRWLDEDRAGLVIRQQLADATDAWQRAGRDPAFCHRGVRLAAAREWAADARHERLLRMADREFLDASIRAEQAEQARERRRVRRLRQILAGLAFALCLTVLAAAVAFQQRSSAQRNLRAATVRQLQAAAISATGTEPRSALLLAVEAFRRDPSQTSRAALLDVLAGTQFSGAIENLPNVVGTVTYSGDGRILVIGTGDGTAQVWDVSQPDHRRKLTDVVAHEQPVFTQGVMASWLDDGGHLLYLLGQDGVMGMFDLADPAHPVGLGTVHGIAGNGQAAGVIQAAAFSPDGHTLVASDLGVLSLWAVGTRPSDVTRLVQLPRHDTGPLNAAVFSPDGRLLALGWQDGTTELWNTTDRSHPLRQAVLTPAGLTPAGRPAVLSAAFSTDGRTLATGADDAQARLWDLTDPAHPRQSAGLSGHGGAVRAVAFSPDGRSLATGSTDRTIALWDVASPATSVRTATFTGHQNLIKAVSFAPDGATLATGGNDDTVLFWSLADRLTPTRSAQPIVGTTLFLQSPYTPLRFSTLDPTGTLLAAWGAGGRPVLMYLTGPSAGRDAGTVDVPDRPQVVFAPDGRALATAARDGTVTVWDVSDPASPVSTAQFRISDGAGAVAYMAVSPDNTLLAVSSAAGPTTIWDISDRRHPVQASSLTAYGTASCAVTFRPRGRILLCGDYLYDLADLRGPKPLGTLVDPDRPHLHVSGTARFSPDGNTLVAAFLKDTYVFDVSDVSATAAPRFRVKISSGAPIPAIAFSPDGRILATVGGGDEVVLWDMTFTSAPHRVTAVTLQAYPRGVAFSETGDTLTTYDEYGNVVRWNIAPLRAAVTDPVARACRLAGANPTQTEWSVMAPGVTFDRVCPTLPEAPSPPSFPVLSPSTSIPAGN